jgi:ubiquinone/menaquinone biosynthesis C-methylase UbiE
MESISFDRAADIYDQTRSHPPGITQSAASVLAGLLPAHANLLEIGIGTGRIALPLHAAGFRLTGLDISRKMMERLRQKQGQQPGPNLIEASALSLPLISGSFDAVVGVHVLHLIPGWRTVLKEVRRVLRPEGSLIIGYDWHPDDCPSSLLRQQWDKLITAYGIQSHPVLSSFEEVLAALRQMGAHDEELIGAEWTKSFTIQDELARLESRTWSATWHVPEAVLANAVLRLKAWSEVTFSTLNAPYVTPRRFIWQRFTWGNNQAAKGTEDGQ